MRVDPLSFNPILGYKLDPGEPGLAHSAPASMSVLRVLTQEVSNYLAFKREAMRKGGFIIGGGIYLDLQKRGGFLAAVAGRTRVWMYIPGERNVGGEPAKAWDHGETDGVSREDIRRKIEELRIELLNTTDPVERQKLEREIAMLEMALNGFKMALSMPQLFLGLLIDTFA